MINLIAFGHFDLHLLDALSDHLEQVFSEKSILRDGYFDLGEFYDPSRRQYDGYRLLRMIEEKFSCQEGKSIGLVNVDLFIPILTFIFGQAYLNGSSAIASTYRLMNERYGMIASELVVVDRFIKEVTHEVGHMYGLIHCKHPGCVMQSSTYVEDIDQKDALLCQECKAKLQMQI